MGGGRMTLLTVAASAIVFLILYAAQERRIMIINKNQNRLFQNQMAMFAAFQAICKAIGIPSEMRVEEKEH
jgi:hypothetical protein